MVNFKGAHHPKDVILYAVYFDVRFALSYRDLEEIMAERGIDVDHATLNLPVKAYANTIAAQARRRKTPTGQGGPATSILLRLVDNCAQSTGHSQPFTKIATRPAARPR